MYKERMQPKLVRLVGVGGVLAAALWLGRLCDRADQITFLPHRAPAEWLVYPKPASPRLQAVADLPTTFRRTFALSRVPGNASLSFCACRRAVVVLNGKELPVDTTAKNWKSPRTLAVSAYLRPGENALSVTVVNALGPPALWLSLQGEGLQVASDAAWEASYAGAVWRPAQLATQAQPAGPGNPFGGLETSVGAFGTHWRWWGGLLLLAGVLVGGGRWWLREAVHRKLPRRWQWTTDPASALLGLLTVLWVVLVVHNLPLVPRSAGFDAEGHLEYIQYIQQHGALPWADEGWEMHQPPLYYGLGAGILNCLRLSAPNPAALLVLRLLGLLIGLVHLAFVWLSLRLLFPSAPGQQVVGLTVAGFLPMQLYLTQYITNEILAACLISATLYGVLRVVVVPETSWRWFLAVGAGLGLALLTKVTALILVPFVAVALLYHVLAGARGAKGVKQTAEASPSQGSSVRSAGARWAGPALCVAACVVVCGWHYWRVWRHFGHAFFVPTRWSYAVGWWQDPGYHTATYFMRSGRALMAPFFSGLSSLGDGLYSTLWGDGLCGGAAEVLFRPPWNYEWMASGFLWALLPTVLIVLGTGVMLLGSGGLARAGIATSASSPAAGPGAEPATPKAKADARKERSPRYGLVGLGLCGFAFAMLLAIVHLNLEVPAFAEAKAIFGLAALIPLSAFAAAGWGVLCRTRKGTGWLLSVGLGVWALNSYASFWVRADSAGTRAALGRARMNEGDLPEAVVQFQRALQAEPRHLAAGSFLEAALLQQDQVPAAAQVAQATLTAHPGEPRCHLDLAAVLERQGQAEQALEHTRRAIELAPDDAEARLKLASRLFALRRLPETIAACREALRVTPGDPEVHFLLASALAAEAQRAEVTLACAGGESLRCGPGPTLSPREVLAAEAINHFEFVVRLAPDTTNALTVLAWTLATHPRPELRDGREAVRLAERACKLTGNGNPSAVAALAAAYAERGQFSLAVPVAAKAEQLAEASGKPVMVALTRQLQAAVIANQPFRQAPPEGH